ncbi:hypothetical protein BgAZ_201570 [Babesia gibsoni]|uniref:Uncharacterized protein n=1 Tax=Babesia gibsoni TaxID=33632 RepID=A0AAD8PE59_BABGI|nr:hypothetical protein BgAZ_201570 [Babesia gibsoni]
MSCKIPEPTNLRDLLDLFGKVNQYEVALRVGEELESKIAKYLDTTEIPGGTIRNNLEKVLNSIDRIREELLKDPSNYGKYGDLCIWDALTYSDFTYVIANWLPSLHHELLYLVIDLKRKELISIEDEGNDNAMPEKDGLSDYLHISAAHSEKSDCESLLKNRGIECNEINQKSLSCKGKLNINVELYENAPLSHIQYGLIFVSSHGFHQSNLANAIAFMEEFCNLGRSGAFDDQYSTAYPERDHMKFKNVYDQIYEIVKPFAGGVFEPLYGPRSNQSGVMQCEKTEGLGLTVVTHQANIYQGRLKYEHLDRYTEWLEANIPSVLMLTHVISATLYTWKTCYDSGNSVSGPLSYGLIPADEMWSDHVEAEIEQKLETLYTINHRYWLSELLDSLKGGVFAPLEPETRDIQPSEKPQRKLSPKSQKTYHGSIPSPEPLTTCYAPQEAYMPSVNVAEESSTGLLPTDGIDVDSQARNATQIGSFKGIYSTTGTEYILNNNPSQTAMMHKVSVVPLIFMAFFFVFRVLRGCGTKIVVRYLL